MRAFSVVSLSITCCAASMVTARNAQAATAATLDAVVAEVKAAIHTQVDAYASRDQAKAASVLAPDIRTFFHGEPDVVGKAAAEASIKAQLALPFVKLEVSEESVDVAASGDLAIYHAKYRFSFQSPQTGQPVVEVGNWVAIFKRQADGAMRLSTDIVADKPAPAGSAQ